jgi:hypothetical protein
VLQARDLLDHASRLVANSSSTDADFRRAVSASYYAVFHLISAAVAEQACPPTPPELRGRFQRALDHKSMKNAMQSFVTLDSLKKLSTDTGITCVYSKDIADIARAFGQLYDAREFADYDVVDSGGTVDFSWASDWVDKVRLAFDAWDRVKSKDEAKLFLASLIFGNKRAKPGS